jgi:hypothetical protein
VVEALGEVQLQPPATTQALRGREEREVVAVAADEAADVVEDVGIATELSRKHKDLRPYNLRHNPVAVASLVVA